jgi:hypothetical protein
MALGIKKPATLNNSIGEFFGRIMQIRIVAHLTHLYQEDNNGWTHEAMQILYKEAPKIADTIIESWQGIYGKIRFSVPESAPVNPLEYMKDLYNYININRNQFRESWIQNEIDNICTLLAQTMFRLQYVK